MRVTPSCDSINTFIVCATDSIQGNPALDFDGTNYVVVWNDNTAGTNRMLAARVTPGGTVLDAGNHIGQTGSDELYPDIVYNGSEYFAVWCHYSEPFGIRGRRVSTQAQPLGSVITIDTTVTYKYMNPKIACDGTNYLVVWPDMLTATNFDIYGQRIAPNGSLLGGRITISDDSSSEREPHVVFEGTKFLVAWNDSGVVVGRYVNTAGQVVGSTFPISAINGRVRNCPWMAASDTNFLVAWEETVGASRDIYGNVDLVIGVQENDDEINPLMPQFPTILSGPLQLPHNMEYAVYDISGCRIDPTCLGPGVYFISVDGKIAQKIIKIK